MYRLILYHFARNVADQVSSDVPLEHTYFIIHFVPLRVYHDTASWQGSTRCFDSFIPSLLFLSLLPPLSFLFLRYYRIAPPLFSLDRTNFHVIFHEFDGGQEFFLKRWYSLFTFSFRWRERKKINESSIESFSRCRLRVEEIIYIYIRIIFFVNLVERVASRILLWLR